MDTDGMDGGEDDSEKTEKTSWMVELEGCNTVFIGIYRDL